MLHPEQVKIFQKMTPEQKLRAAMQLFYSARDLKKAALEKQHPDLSDKEIQQKLRDWVLFARD